MTDSHAIAVDLEYDGLGVRPVPDDHRTSSELDQFWIWAGANVAPINWVLGALGIQLGLSLFETICVIVVGNLVGCALFGAMCLMGHHTGVPQMVLSRVAFGRRGAYLPTLMQVLMPLGWVAINTWVVLDLCVAALERMGISGGMELKYAVAIGVMVLQVTIAAWGFNAIRYFERYTMPVVMVIMAAMTIMAFVSVDIHWNVSTVTGIPKISALTSLMTAIGVGWAIAWLVYASDYTRFASKKLSDRQVFRTTFLGVFVPSVWLASLGAVIASSGSGADPAQLVVAVFGTMALPVLLVLLHGPIATNIVVIYSAALSLAALDLNVRRWIVSIITGVLALFILQGFLHSGGFASSFQNVMILFVVWISPWAGVTLVDYFVVRRKKIELDQLYKDPSVSIYGDVNWNGILALLSGVFCGWLFQVGATPELTGPIAHWLGDIDLSWLVGLLVAGGLYFLLMRSKMIRPAFSHRTRA